MAKEKKDRKSQRSFFGRLLVFLLTVFAWLGVIAMALSILSSFINPSKFVWLTYFGLAFWAILFYNAVILLCLLLLWSRRAWVAILALVIAIPGIYKSFSTGKPQGAGTLRVMSYNVRNFIDIRDDEKTLLETATEVAKMVRENDPDVLCIQEFSHFLPKVNRKQNIAQFGEMAGLPYYYYHTKQYYGSNVLFSKFPIVPLTDSIPFAGENEYGSVALVDAGELGTFNVLCCHLTSYQLTEKEITVFSDADYTKEQREEYGKSIISKLKNAYEKRSYQVCKMLADIPHDGRAILLCGDFNDTPLSYTYHQIKKAGFVDGFVKSGRGIGHTYAGKLPLLRIDYVWGNDRIQPVRFKRLKYKGSDHYPIMMDFNIH